MSATMRNPTSGPPRTAATAVWALGVAAVAALSGINTLANDFTFDDIAIVVQNPAVTGPAGPAGIWLRDYWGHVKGYDPNRDMLYRPLTVSTYRLNHAVDGLRPLGYHALNLLLHAGVAGLVVVTARSIGCSRWAAGMAGLLFAAMPIHTEAVASVVGRAELLAALFTLAAVVLAVRVEPSSRRGTIVWLAGVCAAVLGAMLAKESGITAAMVVPWFALGCRGAPRTAGERSVSRAAGLPLPRVAGVAAAVVVAVVVYVALRSVALEGQFVRRPIPSKVTNLLVEASPAERFWTPWQLLGMYVAKTFWPWQLCADYSYQSFGLARSPLNLSVVIGLATVAVLSLLAVRWWRRGDRVLAVACVAVVVCYLPVSNTIILIRTLFAERLWYLPSVFLAIVVASAVSPAAVGQRRRVVSGMVACAAAAGLLVGWARNAAWQNNGTLFASAYRVHPNSVAVLHGYGGWLVAHGEHERGVELLERCVAIAPGYLDACVTLGAAYLERGQADRALPVLQAAAMGEAVSPEARRLIEEAKRQVAGARGAAIAEAERRYEAHPTDLHALVALTEQLVEAGLIERALSLVDDAGSRFAEEPGFHRARAVALMLSGRRDEGIDAYRASLKLDGTQVDVLAELGVALIDRRGPGDLDEAEDLVSQALALSPDKIQALIARAELYVIAGHIRQAAMIYQRLVDRLGPGEFRDALAARLEVLKSR